MSFYFNNDTPIYLQIIEYVKMQIINSQYQAGDRLPSVRELSLMFEVNPNTVQKALGELEDKGLIFTERTNGKFVTKNIDVINSIKCETIEKKVEEFIKDMQSLGISKSDIVELLRK